MDFEEERARAEKALLKNNLKRAFALPDATPEVFQEALDRLACLDDSRDAGSRCASG